MYTVTEAAFIRTIQVWDELGTPVSERAFSVNTMDVHRVAAIDQFVSSTFSPPDFLFGTLYDIPIYVEVWGNVAIEPQPVISKPTWEVK